MNSNPERENAVLGVSRYEGNLAEFPFAVFTKGEHLSQYAYEDEITGHDGQRVRRTWEVRSAHPEGLPTASTQEVLFGILQLADDQGWPREIHFGSLYRFLQLIGRGDRAKDYARLTRDLDILNATLVNATNALWDPVRQAYVSLRGMKFFQHLKLYTDKPMAHGLLQTALPMSVVRFDELYYELCKTNFVRVPLPADRVFALTPTAQKLGFYLAKQFAPKTATTHFRDVYKLAEQVPIRTTLHRQRKAKLRQAVHELMDAGFPVERYEITRSANGRSEIITFHRRCRYELAAAETNRTATVRPPRRPASPTVNDPDTVAYLVDEMTSATNTGDRNRRFYRLYAERLPKDLIFRAISELKESRDLGEIRTTKGQVFAGILKRVATEQGVTIPRTQSGDMGVGRPTSSDP